jgi:S-DNA-T family DNA segregation ATPase FtsK/SpoIIIE
VSEQVREGEPGGEVIPMPGYDLVPYDEDEYLPAPRPTRITVTNVLDARVIPSKADIAVWVDQTRNGIAWRRHKWGVHGVRLPIYTGRALRSAPRGVGFAVAWWWTWARDDEGLLQRRAQLAKAGGDSKNRDYIAADELHRRRIRWRTGETIAGVLLLALAGRYALTHYPPILTVLAVLAGLCAFGWWGAAPGTIITMIDAPREGVKTGDEVVTAYEKAGITTPISNTGKGSGPVRVLSIPHRAGNGWTCRVELPPGITPDEVGAKLRKLASALYVPGDCLEIDPMQQSAEGIIDMYVALQHPLDQDVPEWPLLHAERRSVFRPFTIGWDSRGNPVEISTMWLHTFIGAAPRRGKTTIMRGGGFATLLDPRAGLIVVDFGGGLDYAAFEPYCEHFICGLETEHVLAFQALIASLKAEHARRMGVIRRAGLKNAPDNRITERLAASQIPPLVVLVDEIQVATTEAGKLGDQIVQELADLMKVSPKSGITFIIGTQDAVSAPTALRNLALQRIALTVPSFQASMAILGNEAQAAGLDASKLGGTPGYGIVWGIDSEFGDGFKGRARFANISAADAEGILERLGRRRPRDADVEATVTDLPDVPAVIAKILDVWPEGSDRVHLDRLAALVGMDMKLLAGGLRNMGLDTTKSVRIGDQVRSGYYLADVERLAGGAG